MLPVYKSSIYPAQLLVYCSPVFVLNRKCPSIVVALLKTSSSFHCLLLSLQGTSTISCVCVWIITSLEESVAAEAVGHIQGSVETHIWDLQDLSIIWRTLLTRQKSKTLIRGFQLFFKVVVIYFCSEYKRMNLPPHCRDREIAWGAETKPHCSPQHSLVP